MVPPNRGSNWEKRKRFEMNTNPTLLPCPFCGSPASLRNASYPALINGRSKQIPWFIVQCANNAPHGENNYNDCGAWQRGPTPEIAAAKWNRRSSCFD